MWGNCTISGNAAVAKANPIRYRGYYYDEDDTGLYYCNARYYSPKWRRFISPDDTAYLDPYSVNGLNQYCYCNNDPINYADPSGCLALPLIIIGLVVGAAIGATVGGVIAYGINIFPTMVGEIASIYKLLDPAIFLVNAYLAAFTSTANSVINLFWRGKQ